MSGDVIRSADDIRHPGLNLGSTDPIGHEAAEELVFGFWVFLMSDLILFALLFATFAVMIRDKAGAPGPHALYDIGSAAAETGILLTSSFTFGLASLAMKHAQRNGTLLLWLGITLLLGLSFLGFEIHDFLSMVGKGGVPEASGFISALFLLVSTHGLHVTAGCVWIAVMMVQVMRFGTCTEVKTRILRLGLFWHFLDIVWIGIFSVVYLQGLA